MNKLASLSLLLPVVLFTHTAAADDDAPRTQPHAALVGAGALVFVSSYVAGGVAGTVEANAPSSWFGASSGLTWIPIAGPFIGLGLSTDGCADTQCKTQVSRATDRALYLVDGLAQLAGVGMFIAGFVWRQKVSRPSHVSVVPTASPTSVGATLAVTW